MLLYSHGGMATPRPSALPSLQPPPSLFHGPPLLSLHHRCSHGSHGYRRCHCDSHCDSRHALPTSGHPIPPLHLTASATDGSFRTSCPGYPQISAIISVRMEYAWSTHGVRME